MFTTTDEYEMVTIERANNLWHSRQNVQQNRSYFRTDYKYSVITDKYTNLRVISQNYPSKNDISLMTTLIILERCGC